MDPPEGNSSSRSPEITSTFRGPPVTTTAAAQPVCRLNPNAAGTGGMVDFDAILATSASLDSFRRVLAACGGSFASRQFGLQLGCRNGDAILRSPAGIEQIEPAS